MILIYHHNDLDGLAAAAVVKKYCEDTTYMRPVNYKNYIPNIDEVKGLDNKYKLNKIFIVDYSFTSVTLDQIKNILEEGYSIVWIDHHQSSLSVKEELNKYKNLEIIIDINFCGAINTYKYFKNDEIPYYLKLVDSWDTWKHFDPNDYPFKLFFDIKSYSDTINLFVKMLKMPNEEAYLIIDEYIEKGKLIEEYAESIYNSDQKRAFEVILNDYHIIVINSSMKSSLLFGDLLKDYDCGIAYHFDGSKYSYSIYTIKDIDVSKIAEMYGGGGHQGAAGFVTEEYIF